MSPISRWSSRCMTSRITWVRSRVTSTPRSRVSSNTRPSSSMTPARMRRSRGSRTCRTTIREFAGCATRTRASLIATLDGDGQNDPADIPRLLAALDTGDLDPSRTLVAGHRVKRRDSRIVRASSRVANAVRSSILRDGTPDTGCGLKVFARSLFLELPYFDHMHRFIPALVRRAGGRVISVPVNHKPRLTGRSHYGVWNRLWTGIVDLVGVMWLTRRAKITTVTEVVAPPPFAGMVVERDGRASLPESGGSVA